MICIWLQTIRITWYKTYVAVLEDFDRLGGKLGIDKRWRIYNVWRSPHENHSKDKTGDVEYEIEHVEPNICLRLSERLQRICQELTGFLIP